MTTLKEIALEAGVHVATASAVLNGSGGNTRVSVETQKRVLSAAKKLAYVPNETARRLRTGKSSVVGFLGGDLRNPFFAELAAALEVQLAGQELQLMVSHVTHQSEASVEKSAKILQQQGVSKIICWDESEAAGKGGRESVLSIGFSDRTRPGVWLDLAHAIHLSVASMVNCGYQRLGFFAPCIQKESPSVSIRSRIFLAECKRLGIEAPEVVSYDGESWDLDAATEGGLAMVKNYAHVQGWIGFNDIASLGLLNALPARRVQSILCFDGTAATRCWPGRPFRLNLQVLEFSRKVVSVLCGQLSAAECGKREGWIKPALETYS